MGGGGRSYERKKVRERKDAVDFALMVVWVVVMKGKSGYMLKCAFVETIRKSQKKIGNRKLKK